MEPLETLWPCPLPEAVHATMHLGHTNQHCVLSSLPSGASKITATLGVPFIHPCSPLNLTWFPPGGGGKSPVCAHDPRLPPATAGGPGLGTDVRPPDAPTLTCLT